MAISEAMPKTNTYSIKRQILAGSMTIFLLFSALVFAGSTYYSYIVRSQMYNSMKDIHDMYKNQMVNEFTTSERYLYGLINNSTDISVLDANQQNTDYYISIDNIERALQNILPCFSTIDGMFVYSIRSDVFIRYWKEPDSLAFSTYLKKSFEVFKSSHDFGSINKARWTQVNLNGQSYFMKIIQVGNSFVGAWASAESLLSVFSNMRNVDSQTFFMFEDGNFVGQTMMPTIAINPVDAMNRYQIVKDARGETYLAIAEKVENIECYLVTFISNEFLLGKLSETRFALLLTGAMVLILGISLSLMLNRYLNKPLKSLLIAINSLHAGNFDTKVDTENEKCEEFSQVNRSFNNMVEKIQKLKIDVYEEQLERNQIELMYLKSQVAPHFLINCLNILYCLSANPQNHEIIRKITVALSDHLRYTLARAKRVRLSEEIKFAANFLELSNYFFPDCMKYELQIDPRTENASVIPMMALMFLENTVKHELIMGERLYVMIQTRLIQSDSVDRVHLLIIDSGEGFSEEFLHAVSQKTYKPHSEKGYHIGIENIIRQMKMEYSGRATVRFSNEPGSGARVDIEIPFATYLPVDSEDDNPVPGEPNEHPHC